MVVDLAFLAHGFRTAHRALVRHGEQRAALIVGLGKALGHHADHFGNHVAGAAHDDGVAHAHVLAAGFVLVMQRGVGHGHAADEYRRQLGHRRQLAGATDLDFDAEHLGQLLLRRVLVGHGPARLAGDEAQLPLQRDAVDLVDHAVDVVGQGVALAADVLVESDQLDGAGGPRRLLGDREAPGLELRQPVELGRAIGAAFACRRDFAQPIGKEAQGPRRGNRRVELAHRARRRVARIDEHLLVLLPGRDLLALALVERVEVGTLHVDLAAHFDHGWRLAVQAQRNLAHRADVLRDLFADLAVAAGRGLHQHAVFVAQVHGQAVELEFADIRHLRSVLGQTEFLAHPRIEGAGAAGRDVGLGADRQHRHLVAHLGEAVEHLAAHPLCRRVGRAQVGVFGLDGLQALEQLVVLGVRQFGRVKHVIQVGVPVELFAQCGGFACRFVARCHGCLRKVRIS